MKPFLNSIFTDGAVFAVNQPIRVFGGGQGRIEGVFCGEKGVLKEREDGWMLEFSARGYGGPFEMELFLDGEKTTLSDIYVGEVILCSGQSNMQFKLESSTEKAENYKTCELVRFFTVDRLEEGEYFKESDGWVKCRKEIAGCFSAIGYYVATMLSEKKGCAVGVISAYQGASAIRSWMPSSSLPIQAKLIPDEKLHPDNFFAWNGEGTLYEKMLAKIIPYSLSRVIWYQGESNTSIAESEVFDEILSALIGCWREAFSLQKLPFCVIQIADLDEKSSAYAGWERLQEKQLEVSKKVPFTQTVVCRDVCETNDIHPPTKNKLCERIVATITQ